MLAKKHFEINPCAINILKINLVDAPPSMPPPYSPLPSINAKQLSFGFDGTTSTTPKHNSAISQNHVTRNKQLERAIAREMKAALKKREEALLEHEKRSTKHKWKLNKWLTLMSCF